MLETIHEFAREKLRESGEAEEMQKRHARYFTAFAEKAAQYWNGSEQAAWFDRMESELDNLRIVLDWALTECDTDESRRRVKLGLETAISMFFFWYIRGYFSEGRDWVSKLLYAARSLPGQKSVAGEELPGASPAKGDEENLDPLIGRNGVNAAALAVRQHDAADARALAEQALEIARACHSQDLEGRAITLLGMVAMLENDYRLAIELLTENLALARELGNEVNLATGLLNLGVAVQCIRDWERGDDLLGEALLLFERLGNPLLRAYVVEHLGRSALSRGEPLMARRYLIECLRVLVEFHDTRLINEVLSWLARVEQAEGRVDRAARLVGAAEMLRKNQGTTMAPADRPEYEHCIKLLHSQLPEEAFATAWQEGQAMSLEEAIAYALEGS